MAADDADEPWPACPTLLFGGGHPTIALDPAAVAVGDCWWTLDQAGLLLADGRVDRDRAGCCPIDVPDVDEPTGMTVSLYAGTDELLYRVARCEVVVITPHVTAATRRWLKGLDVAVYGGRDGLRALLDRSEVAYVPLDQRHALDYFEGNVLIVGSGLSGCGLGDLLASLEGRLRDGLQIVLLPQDRAWEMAGFQHTRRIVIEPEDIAVSIPEFGTVWIPVPDGTDAMWIVEPASESVEPDRFKPLLSIGSPPRALAARLKIGAGALWVCCLHQCRDVATSPAGLYVLDRMLQSAALSAHQEPGPRGLRK